MHDFIVLAIPVVALISVFTFVSIAAWSDARRKEREAYYRSETLKKIAESSGAGGQAALEYLREEERIRDRRAERRASEGRKVGGLVCAAVGIGLMLLLWGVTGKNDKLLLLVGAVPFLVGVALLAYEYLLAPKED